MIELYMADVGDGLCYSIRPWPERAAGAERPSVMLIDWGGSRGREACNALEVVGLPNAFVLSHYHRDHYNGLLHAAYPPSRGSGFIDLRSRLSISNVYYPGLPSFANNTVFLKALISISLRTVGRESGVQEYDFLRALRRLSSGPFTSRPLFRGDEFSEGGLNYEILWPPDQFNRGRTFKVVEDALDKFDAALAQDSRLKRLYDRVSREGVVDYIAAASEARESNHYGELEVEYERRQGLSPEDARLKHAAIDVGYEGEPAEEDMPEDNSLPHSVLDALKALRGAANHMCLVIAEGDRLLLMGDVEKRQIQRVVRDLSGKGRTSYQILVTPHHGTHWHDSLKQISCNFSLSSSGKRLYPKLDLRFKDISGHAFATGLNGHLRLRIR